MAQRMAQRMAQPMAQPVAQPTAQPRARPTAYEEGPVRLEPEGRARRTMRNPESGIWTADPSVFAKDPGGPFTIFALSWTLKGVPGKKLVWMERARARVRALCGV